MAGPDTRFSGLPGTTARGFDPAIDAGLRAYMLRVYNYMTGGLALTGLVAYAVAATPPLFNAVYGSGLAWLVMLSPFAFVLVLSFGIHKLKASTAQLLYWLFAGVMGLSLAHIFIIYTGTSIARVFFITAATFGAMSLYGYTTKRDLTAWRSFLFMGLIGIIIAMIVNIFIQSTMMMFLISVVGVLVFVGLTAYDTQKIKESYSSDDGSETMAKKSIMGALRLYLDFLNLFLMLLHLFGARR